MAERPRDACSAILRGRVTLRLNFRLKGYVSHQCLRTVSWGYGYAVKSYNLMRITANVLLESTNVAVNVKSQSHISPNAKHFYRDTVAHIPTKLPQFLISSLSVTAETYTGAGRRKNRCFAASLTHRVKVTRKTSSSGMAERPRELGDFKGVGHFEPKF